MRSLALLSLFEFIGLISGQVVTEVADLVPDQKLSATISPTIITPAPQVVPYDDELRKRAGQTNLIGYYSAGTLCIFIPLVCLSSKNQS
jgi:hypothetical protein